MSGSRAEQEAVLMRQVAGGDRQAFLQLYDRYAARVFGLARRMAGDRLTAEEITQDAFLRLWTRAASFRPERGRLLSWLLTITRRLALDRFRLESRRPQIADPQNPEQDWTEHPDPQSSTEEARWSSLRFALLDLPPAQRTAIELAFYYGLSHSEIADHLEIPLGTVKTRLRLGMVKLRSAWLERADPIGEGRR